jgi:hypothetical protein
MEKESGELNELYVLVGINDAGQEGVASFIDPRDGVMKPALGGQQRVPELEAIGQALANASGHQLRLTRWEGRKNIGVFRPEAREEE